MGRITPTVAAIGLVTAFGLASCSSAGRAISGPNASDPIAAAPVESLPSSTTPRPSTSSTTAVSRPDPIRLVAAGDSYSSGEGLDDANGNCGRSSTAYGELVAAELADRGRLDGFHFVACTAATTGSWPEQQAQLAGEQPTVIAATFGGNDAGFVELLADCIGVDDGAELIGQRDQLDLERATELLFGRGCDASEEDIAVTLEALGPTLEILYGDMADLVGPEGRVFILGYPAPLADPTAWSARVCEGISPDDARLLQRAADRLNDEIRQATLAVDRVRFVSVAEEFDGHGRCGGDPWLFGLTDALGQAASGEATTLRLARPFHPDADGHRAMARLLLAAIDDEPGIG